MHSITYRADVLPDEAHGWLRRVDKTRRIHPVAEPAGVAGSVDALRLSTLVCPAWAKTCNLKWGCRRE